MVIAPMTIFAASRALRLEIQFLYFFTSHSLFFHTMTVIGWTGVESVAFFVAIEAVVVSWNFISIVKIMSWIVEVVLIEWVFRRYCKVLRFRVVARFIALTDLWRYSFVSNWFDEIFRWVFYIDGVVIGCSCSKYAGALRTVHVWGCKKY